MTSLPEKIIEHLRCCSYYGGERHTDCMQLDILTEPEKERVRKEKRGEIEKIIEKLGGIENNSYFCTKIG